MAESTFVAGESSGQHDNNKGSEVELNIKTLDSRIHTFRVNTNMLVSALKDIVASAIGVPVGQQRLIFRGRVLKDDHHLSDYQVENGHTLHLVERQPVQPQTPGGPSTGNANENSNNNANDPTAAGSRGRVGQVSHSVVLGTFNVGGDQGESIAPDLGRIIGAVLNSVGLGNLASSAGTSSSSSSVNLSSSNVQENQGTEARGTQGNGGNGSLAGNIGHMGQAVFNLPFQSLQSSLQMPLAGAAVNGSSLPMAIPDSLTTLSEFITRLEQALSENGIQSSSSPSNDMQRPNGSSINVNSLPTVEGLTTVMRRAQQLLSNHVERTISNLAVRIETEASSNVPSVRSEIQGEAMRVGAAMQHLGALFLELGRTIMTLRMGQSPAESVLNTGPSVYISQFGPNPIMVQPFPFQTTSLFSGSSPAAPPTNAGLLAVSGVGDVPRNVSIHIHAGTSVSSGLSSLGTRIATGGATSNQVQPNGNGGGPPLDLPVRSIVAAVPVRSPAEAGGHVLSVLYPLNARSLPNSTTSLSTSRQVPNPPASSAANPPASSATSFPSTPLPTNGSAPSHLSDSNSGILNASTSEEFTFGSTGGGEGQKNLGMEDIANRALKADVPGGLVSPHTEDIEFSGQQPLHDDDPISMSDMEQPSSTAAVNLVDPGPVASSISNFLPSENVASSSSGSSTIQQSQQAEKTVPLGLGAGGLQPKKKNKPVKTDLKVGPSLASSNQNESVARGQQILRTLVSRRANPDEVNRNASAQAPPFMGQMLDDMDRRNEPTGVNAPTIMSEVLNSSVMDNILTGMSEQAGFSSPGGLRNILQQVTQSPSMRNILDRITQQVGQGHGVESMLSGLGGDQDGGIDLAGMIQHMMPIVSQALGGSLTGSAPTTGLASISNETTERAADKLNENCQAADLNEVVQSIESQQPPEAVFRAMVENANRVNGESILPQDVIEELCSSDDLVKEYMEMLQHDLARR